MLSAWASRMWRTRCPRTARIRMLASSTSALPGIPLLLAAGATDLLVLLDEFVLGCTPRCDHGVEFLCGCSHGIDFSLAALLLRRDKEAEGLAVSSDGERFSGLQVTCEVLAELSHADLFGLHSCVLCVHNNT